jgi:hypothetical protein
MTKNVMHNMIVAVLAVIFTLTAACDAGRGGNGNDGNNNALDALQGVWEGQTPNGTPSSVIFIGSKVFVPAPSPSDFFAVTIMSSLWSTGTVTYKNNAGTCSFGTGELPEGITIPFTVKGASMEFGYGGISRTKTAYRLPPDIGGIWSNQGGDFGLIFINDIVYAYARGSSSIVQYTYNKGSGTIDLDDGRWTADFTVSGNTLTVKHGDNTFVLTR